MNEAGLYLRTVAHISGDSNSYFVKIWHMVLILSKLSDQVVLMRVIEVESKPITKESMHQVKGYSSNGV